MQKTVFYLALLAAAFSTPQAHAVDRLKFAAGGFDVIDDWTTFEGRLEYLSDYNLTWDIKPFTGLMVNADGGYYAYAGVYRDFMLGERTYLTPSFAPGYYEDGGGKYLGHHLEFRSEVEVSYEFDNMHRLGASFSHMSNASIADSNPGAESAMVSYSIPLQ